MLPEPVSLPSACWSQPVTRRGRRATRVPRPARSEARPARPRHRLWHRCGHPRCRPPGDPGGRAVGLDPSAEFLALARGLAREAGLSGVIEFRQGDALALLGNGEFDAALAVTVLAHVPEGHRAIPEMVRVMRSGGRRGGLRLRRRRHADFLTRIARSPAASSPLFRPVAMDGWLGRRLPGLLRQAGLLEVGARAFAPIEQDPKGFYARWLNAPPRWQSRPAPSPPTSESAGWMSWPPPGQPATARRPRPRVLLGHQAPEGPMISASGRSIPCSSVK